MKQLRILLLQSMIDKVEFFNTPDGDVFAQLENGEMYKLSECRRDIVQDILSDVRNIWPGAFERLVQDYQKHSLNKPYFEFRMASRFCRCNVGNYDTLCWDIDEYGNWHLEKVSCPMRGECPDEGVICMPKMKTQLSEREMEIADRLSYQAPEEIAEELALSIRTVYNHIQAIKIRLKLKTIAQITTWYNTRK